MTWPERGRWRRPRSGPCSGDHPDADRDAISTTLGLRDAWPVLGESFLDWAVEDRFAAGRSDWSLGGARFVERAEPWEHLKLRMVNGSQKLPQRLLCNVHVRLRGTLLQWVASGARA